MGEKLCHDCVGIVLSRFPVKASTMPAMIMIDVYVQVYRNTVQLVLRDIRGGDLNFGVFDDSDAVFHADSEYKIIC